MSADLATSLLVQLGFAAPLLLVWCVGIILAATRRYEAPARSRLVLSAVGAVRTLAEVGGWVLLLLALFPRRPAPPNVVAGPSRSGPDGG